MGLHLLYRVALFGISVHALAFLGPQPTQQSADELQEYFATHGWTPKPTVAPSPHQVLRRQKELASTYLFAPDETCGYLDGSSR